MSDSRSVQKPPVVSDAAIREVLHHHYHEALHVRKTHTRLTLSQRSGVDLPTLDKIMGHSNGRRIAVDDALSLAYAMGEAAVNGLIGAIGYGGATRLGEPHPEQPLQIVTTLAEQLGRIAKAAADNRIDHTEEPETTEASDIIIATVLPLSSAGKSA